MAGYDTAILGQYRVGLAHPNLNKITPENHKEREILRHIKQIEENNQA
jgi:hypothetical protein